VIATNNKARSNAGLVRYGRSGKSTLTPVFRTPAWKTCSARKPSAPSASAGRNPRSRNSYSRSRRYPRPSNGPSRRCSIRSSPRISSRAPQRYKQQGPQQCGPCALCAIRKVDSDPSFPQSTAEARQPGHRLGTRTSRPLIRERHKQQGPQQCGPCALCAIRKVDSDPSFS
jgi:hypothetical protein